MKTVLIKISRSKKDASYTATYKKGNSYMNVLITKEQADQLTPYCIMVDEDAGAYHHNF